MVGNWLFVILHVYFFFAWFFNLLLQICDGEKVAYLFGGNMGMLCCLESAQSYCDVQIVFLL